MARYKLPKRVFFWDALPKSGYGKITKRIVREELEARGCLPLTSRARLPPNPAGGARKRGDGGRVRWIEPLLMEKRTT